MQQQIILANGTPPLTQDAADAALDVIHFIAAVVRGFDAIGVTEVIKPLWRAHLASFYPYLPALTQQWYANAPWMLLGLNAQWPLLDPWTRSAVLQQWSLELPQMLAILEPVLAAAHAGATQASVRAQLAAARAEAARDYPTAPQSQTQAVDELARQRQMTESLISHSTRMANLTTGLMQAMSRAR
jgi:hypothetical protein